MDSDVAIRHMEEKDIGSVLAVGKGTECLWCSDEDKFFKRKDLEKWVRNKRDDVLLVAEAEGKVAGFLLAETSGWGGACIISLAVDEKFRHMHIGTGLMDECMKQLKQSGISFAYLLANTSNLEGIEFWKKKGFKEGYKFVFLSKNI